MGGGVVTWCQHRLAAGRSTIEEEDSTALTGGLVLERRECNQSTCLQVQCVSGSVNLYFDAILPSALKAGQWLGT